MIVNKGFQSLYNFLKLAFILISALLPNHLFSQSYSFRNFGSANGLPQTFIYSIVQDTHGYLWVGTGNGLSRYNGFVFENFTTKDSLADNFITSAISDGECLWFGHINGKVSLFNGKDFKTIVLPQSTSQITHLEKNSEGQIWASTYSDGLFKLDKGDNLIKHVILKNPVSIKTFAFLNHRELIIGTNTGLLHCRLNISGEIETIRTILEIPETNITSIIKNRNSGFYIATENEGIFTLNYENNSIRVSRLKIDTLIDFSGTQDLYEDNRSNLWISTFGKGLVKLVRSSTGVFTKTFYFNKENGFITDNIKTLFQDVEGNIWSGNYGEGLTQIAPKNFTDITFDEKLYGKNILSICSDQQFKWIGTESGLIKIDNLTNNILRFYSNGNGLPKDAVTTIFLWQGKELWLGTENNGVFRLELKNEKIIRYPLGNEALENSIKVITGKGKHVWIGTKKGLFCIDPESNIIKKYSISQGGLPHNNINSIYIDSKNKVWVTTRSNTLAYIFDNKVNKIFLNASDGNFTLGPVTEDQNSRIWVGSIGKGVYMIGNDSIANFTVNNGLISDYCYSLICDNQNNIWVGHKGGISRIKTKDFSVKPVPYFEGKMDTYECNSNAVTSDKQNRLLFGSEKGIVSYDVSMENPVQVPPVLGIISIKINDEETDFSENITLSPGKYKLRIDFLGISLNEPELVSYQYKLDGYDQWSDLTKKTNATYHNLSEGEYTFILKASSGDGIITEKPLTLTITIKKPIWKKWWFYPTIGLCLIFLSFMYVKRREYHFQAEKRILEEKVNERTNEIKCQKDKIESQRDAINLKNKEILASITYASYIQNAVLPSLELVNNLLPENFVFHKPKDIVSGDFYWLTKKDNKIVYTVADCTGHGVPGAFMSLLGITILNEIVNIQGITISDVIVTKLRENIFLALHQDRKDNPTTDGMDIALCVYNQQNKKLQYTGNMNDLVYIRDGKMKIIKADRFLVWVENEHYGPFTIKEVNVKKGDVFYLFTDGFPDQFGGDYNKKFLTRRFYNMLIEIHHMDMPKQREIIENRLNDWMKDNNQTDDITVMGVRF